MIGLWNACFAWNWRHQKSYKLSYSHRNLIINSFKLIFFASTFCANFHRLLFLCVFYLYSLNFILYGYAELAFFWLTFRTQKYCSYQNELSKNNLEKWGLPDIDWMSVGDLYIVWSMLHVILICSLNIKLIFLHLCQFLFQAWRSTAGDDLL